MKKLEKVLVALVLLAAGAALSFVITYTELTNAYSSVLDQLSSSEIVTKNVELEMLIDTYFVGETDKTAMADAAASAMVDATGDRWSHYISAADYQRHVEQQNNAYVGIGVTIQQTEDESGFTIMEVVPGGSAEEAGVLVGDILIAVDGQSAAGITVDDVVAMVRGEEGTFVSLTFLRDAEEIAFSVERRTIEQIVATGTLLEGNVGYIVIENFDKNCAAHSIAAIESVVEQGATSLLFDVRNNPGGYQYELVDLLDYLLPEGVLFRMKYYNGEEQIDYSDEDCVKLPMAVLINEDSYSAAEFFAAAIQEYEAGTIVGARTSGKGYFQNTYQLSDGSAVALSSGTYYTPNNISLADVGVIPDVETVLSEEEAALLYYNQLDPTEDDQLQAALEILR